MMMKKTFGWKNHANMKIVSSVVIDQLNLVRVSLKMGINMEEVTRKKNDFINSIDKLLTESNVRTEDATKRMNELNRQAAKNIQELSLLLGSGHSHMN